MRRCALQFRTVVTRTRRIANARRRSGFFDGQQRSPTAAASESIGDSAWLPEMTEFIAVHRDAHARVPLAIFTLHMQDQGALLQ
jgi:hypothetical protein